MAVGANQIGACNVSGMADPNEQISETPAGA
jgi:hypothetical protein